MDICQGKLSRQVVSLVFEHQHTGQMDVHLSEYGKKQAMLLAKSLATESFSKLYTSDLVRCVEVGGPWWSYAIAVD